MEHIAILKIAKAVNKIMVLNVINLLDLSVQNQMELIYKKVFTVFQIIIIHVITIKELYVIIQVMIYGAI
jgi:hypothetical protein